MPVAASTPRGPVDRTIALAADTRVRVVHRPDGRRHHLAARAGPAVVGVRASLTDLLLVIYRRKAVRGNGIEIVGDHKLLDLWLSHIAFA